MLCRRRCSLRRIVLWWSGIACIAFLLYTVSSYTLTDYTQVSVRTRHWVPYGEDSLLTAAVYNETVLGNYEPQPEVQTSGLGEGGVAVRLPGNKTSMRLYGCEMDVSDVISLNRTIPDSRNKECRYWHYPSNLPTASVVIIFYNEGNSTLLRMIHSIISRSPPHLLKEIVLIDDASTLDHLKQPLEGYIRRFNGKVKIYRNEERLGLIGARMRGAREATGDVMVVLDSHCECNANWLPPLLQRIALNRKTLAQPTVDMISYETFAYVNAFSNTLPIGVFDWGLLYKEIYKPIAKYDNDTKHHKTEPFKQPTHAGGLFAIDRLYFLEIGGYDENIKVWGGENFQLSFKVWMCGGQIEQVPCSRVGHVYHKLMPFSLASKDKLYDDVSIVDQNYLRIVEGWMDEYSQYFYTVNPQLKGHYVNVTDQMQLRKKLGCHTFHWFMENVAKEMLSTFPLPKPNVAVGAVRQRSSGTCLSNDCYVDSCAGQLFRLNSAGQIAYGEYCLVYDEMSQKFSFPKCYNSSSNPWDWNLETGLIRHPTLRTCINGGPIGTPLSLAPCNDNVPDQQWEMEREGEIQAR